MQKKPKALSLNRETLGPLEIGDLSKVAAGSPSNPSCDDCRIIPPSAISGASWW